MEKKPFFRYAWAEWCDDDGHYNATDSPRDEEDSPRVREVFLSHGFFFASFFIAQI